MPWHVGSVARWSRRPGGRSSSRPSSKPFIRKTSRWDSASCSCAGVSCRRCLLTSGWRSIFDSRFSPSKRNFSSEACWSTMKSWRPLSPPSAASPLVFSAAMMNPRLNWPTTRILEKQLLSNWNLSETSASPPLPLTLASKVANFATASRDARPFSGPRRDAREKALGKCTSVEGADPAGCWAARWRLRAAAASISAIEAAAMTLPPMAWRNAAAAGARGSAVAEGARTTAELSPASGDGKGSSLMAQSPLTISMSGLPPPSALGRRRSGCDHAEGALAAPTAGALGGSAASNSTTWKPSSSWLSSGGPLAAAGAADGSSANSTT
mmetsp:Transcript_37779/g.112233  ORF Transcript_37779/g.112233 Transcript_37779/m.112233 type:complete len:325 (+) Transcript_37779:517-1491(+)